MSTQTVSPVHVPPAVCDCGHAPTAQPPGSGGTGYARDRDTGATYCYECADARQRAEIADPATVTLGGYLATDGRTVTTWTGGELARVLYEGTSRTGWHGSTITYVTARTPDGRTWYGRNGGRSMCLHLRAHKHPITH